MVKDGDIMNRLIDKSSVLILCMICLSQSENAASSVAAAIAAVCISCIVQCFPGTFCAYALIAGYSLMCGVFPQFLLALPLILCDALWEKKIPLILPAITVVPHLHNFLPEQLVLTAAGTLISLIIYLRMSKMEETIGNLTSLRDQIAGKNMLLSQQNTRLVQAQDNERGAYADPCAFAVRRSYHHQQGREYERTTGRSESYP